MRAFMVPLLILAVASAIGQPGRVPVESDGRPVVTLAGPPYRSFGGGVSYAWLSRREILVRTGRDSWRRYDLTTGQSSDDTGIAAAFAADGLTIHTPAGYLVPKNYVPADGWAPSPDGRWMLAYGYRFGFYAARVDGAALVRVKADWSNVQLCAAPIWDSDSRGWTVFTRHGAAVWTTTYRLDGGPSEKHKGGRALVGHFRPLQGVGSRRFLALVDGGDTIYDSDNGRGTPVAKLLDSSRWDDPQTMTDPRASPDGRSIAWVGLTPQGVSGELWVGRIDGSHRRLLATFPDEPSPAAGFVQHAPPNPNAPTELEWTPDGKSVSFVYKGAIWAVPIR